MDGKVLFIEKQSDILWDRMKKKHDRKQKNGFQSSSVSWSL